MTLDRAMTQLRVAEASWQNALKQHRTAPPDAGYPRRLRELADACEQQQIAYDYAATQGLGWKPLPPAKRPAPHELSPESGRPGPPETWQEFDQAIEDLSRAFEGISVAAIARAFGELSRIARALSAAVADHGSEQARGRRPA
ncbi:hypothetical protein [Conexibacter sp. DBS9H8]|uniref:hypothetical protein n=1 Tax=Conexibacter sp. DBS9H8 TaxID=2937801 RepID=UPI00200FE6B5|nr:hypothetical protein [Conexibacter sp. DBS9H8]